MAICVNAAAKHGTGIREEHKLRESNGPGANLPREQHGAPSLCLHVELQVGVVNCCFASHIARLGSPKIASREIKNMIRELVHQKMNLCRNGIYN